jgi:hypothetical protein
MFQFYSNACTARNPTTLYLHSLVLIVGFRPPEVTGLKSKTVHRGLYPTYVSRPRRYLSMVPVLLIFRCNNSTPYSSASAVGGQPGT